MHNSRLQPVYLHDKAEIEKYLRQETSLHLYELGDLDDFFWPYTSWIADRQAGQVQALILVYSGGGLPVVVALAGEEWERLRGLLAAAARQPLLPRRFYSHLSPGFGRVLAVAGYRLEPHGQFLKMELTCQERLESVDTRHVVQLGMGDEAELQALYAQAYPGNSFDPRMLETGCYYGIRREGRLASVAGVHVYSPAYRAAALGNITTHPEYRGQGLGTAVTARLCQALRDQVDWIGLNVRADNVPAVATYTRLGFIPVAEYEEYTVEGV
jgi:ribosomal protein S18 acetylase RimI-like enzyme